MKFLKKHNFFKERRLYYEKEKEKEKEEGAEKEKEEGAEKGKQKGKQTPHSHRLLERNQVYIYARESMGTTLQSLILRKRIHYASYK